MGNSASLQVYALYESAVPFDDVYYLVLHFESGKNSSGGSWKAVSGLMFDKITLEMKSAFTLTLPVEFKRVGYIYAPQNGFRLKLERTKNEH